MVACSDPVKLKNNYDYLLSESAKKNSNMPMRKTKNRNISNSARKKNINLAMLSLNTNKLIKKIITFFTYCEWA